MLAHRQRRARRLDCHRPVGLGTIERQQCAANAFRKVTDTQQKEIRLNTSRFARVVSCAVAIFAFAPLLGMAALKPGDKAPDFSTEASLDGKVFSFVLADALKRGPVVLYFYPAAFTEGCTIEAHNFAEATDKYKALGAMVIGVSHDDIATLKRFSVSECRSKFAVAADTNRTISK